MRNINCNILTGSDASTINGIQVDANQLVSGSFHIYFGDVNAAGTFKLQASNDPCAYGNLAKDFTVTNWVDIPSQTATITAGASALLTIANMTYRWVRAVMTITTPGATTVNVNMNALSC